MVGNGLKWGVRGLGEEGGGVELGRSVEDEFMEKVREVVKEGLGKKLNVDRLWGWVKMRGRRL